MRYRFKNMKKTISIFLCVCLVVLSFVSCKSKKDDSATIADETNYTYDAAYSVGDATVRAYKDLCKAVVSGSSEIRINSGFLDDVLQLFYTSFPLSALVERIEPVDAGYKIVYKYSDAHNNALKFLEKVNSIKSDVDDNNETVYAINLYNKIASSIKISENNSISCYETVMKGEGTAFSYSNMFEYLLQQKGIKAYHILCEDAAGNSKAISAAELDGNTYYFDLMSEYYDNGGKLLKFFGMTTADAEEIGLCNFIYTNRSTAEDLSDLKFESCRYCEKWELDGKDLLITRNDEEVVRIAL